MPRPTPRLPQQETTTSRGQDVMAMRGTRGSMHGGRCAPVSYWMPRTLWLQATCSLGTIASSPPGLNTC
eukprot:scaffold53900_cov72-Phaeocystis_antarctica.AAC.3